MNSEEFKEAFGNPEYIAALGVASEIAREVSRARSMFPAIINPHEALGVVQEEFDEFKDEVYAYNPFKNRDTRPAMRTELIQLAAMCVRTIMDVIDIKEIHGKESNKD
jgi:hypothetical protein